MRRKLVSTLAPLVLAVALAACASSSGSTKLRSGSPDKLTKAQIEEVNANTALEAVMRLRPKWANPPGLTMTGMQSAQKAQVLVYMDGVRMGGLDYLRTISTTSITSMEFFSPSRAATEVRDIGPGAAVSVIMVRTR